MLLPSTARSASRRADGAPDHDCLQPHPAPGTLRSTHGFAAIRFLATAAIASLRPQPVATTHGHKKTNTMASSSTPPRDARMISAHVQPGSLEESLTGSRRHCHDPGGLESRDRGKQQRRTQGKPAPSSWAHCVTMLRHDVRMSAAVCAEGIDYLNITAPLQRAVRPPPAPVPLRSSRSPAGGSRPGARRASAGRPAASWSRTAPRAGPHRTARR
jgi:hypothetical protein